jgi:hypothetical protein
MNTARGAAKRSTSSMRLTGRQVVKTQNFIARLVGICRAIQDEIRRDAAIEHSDCILKL